MDRKFVHVYPVTTSARKKAIIVYTAKFTCYKIYKGQQCTRKQFANGHVQRWIIRKMSNKS